MRTFVRERNEALLSLDKEKIAAYCEKYQVNFPVKDEHMYWRSVHKAISGLVGLKGEQLQVQRKSVEWLLAHGYTPYSVSCLAKKEALSNKKTPAAVKSGKIPYDLFSEKGFAGITEWYEAIGATDVRNVHVNPDSSKKICEALERFHPDKGTVNMAFCMYGPSGFHEDVPDDQYYYRPKEEILS